MFDRLPLRLECNHFQIVVFLQVFFGVLALRSLESRLARVLLALAESTGEKDTDGSVTVRTSLSQRELGEITGATRESVNKTLRHWREHGIAEMHEKQFHIHDLEEFRELVDQF